jgi:hypothetical protein
MTGLWTQYTIEATSPPTAASCDLLVLHNMAGVVGDNYFIDDNYFSTVTYS